MEKFNQIISAVNTQMYMPTLESYNYVNAFENSDLVGEFAIYVLTNPVNPSHTSRIRMYSLNQLLGMLFIFINI